jgi:mono/diheme cytochrome c family protein
MFLNMRPILVTPLATRADSRLAIATLLILSAAACSEKPPLGPFDGYDSRSTKPVNTDVNNPPPQTNSACIPVDGESLPPRKAIITSGTIETGSDDQKPTTTTVTRARLFAEFKASCGQASCHGSRNGNDAPLARSPERFTVSETTFHLRPDLGSASNARIKSTNAAQVMPPGSGDGSKRRVDDPIRLLGEKLLAWEEAGFPDSFEVADRDPGPATPVISELPKNPYDISPRLGSTLTNIGTCLPTPLMKTVADEMATRDNVFAKAKSFDDLPNTLVETDLVTLDSEALARRGVFSYAPTYTLFSDNASKMRYVRVPMGKKIRYNPSIKDFDIPANTRFYKTFLRKVIDKNGEVGFRKIETRLIVSRPDEKMSDGSYQTRSLMIVYAWDREEKMARKVTDPQRSLEPWADRLCPYITDESVARDPKKNPISKDMNRATCVYMTDDELANPASGKIRHYGIPSQQRCVECHMGSQNHSFILGFTPWDVDRRSAGEGGEFSHDPPTADELEQLQRLTKLGVVEGIAPGSARLEDSQGERKPRNDHELKAQGYMKGNCAFCHNPTGFPTVQNPILASFDMYPSDTGGVFQFPLEKYSSRAKVGPAQTLRHPYITPAFGDFAAEDGYGSPFGQVKEFSPQAPFPASDYVLDAATAAFDDPSFPEEFDPRAGMNVFRYLGPWRSLIWRNVYTPFTYEEDNAIFIHMPRNVPGFDCNAQKIMGEWMLSIPSVPKFEKNSEGYRPTQYNDEIIAPRLSGFEQPYVEVKPGDRPYDGITFSPVGVSPGDRLSYGYDHAVAAADKRVKAFRQSLTYQHCPDDQDIVDPDVAQSSTQLAPIDKGTLNGPRVNPLAKTLFDVVPDHAHWVPVDITEAPGRWIPRRSAWKEILVDRNPAIKVSDKVTKVIDALQGLYLSPARQVFSTQPIPLGFWSNACQSSPDVAQFTTLGALRTESKASPAKWQYWYFDRDPSKDGKSRFGPVEEGLKVHLQSRGEAVFRAICSNCHGRDVDSRSPLATTILELTGGQTRVANLRDGIFGPVGAPGQYADSEFSRANRGGTPADWAVRYAVFMGLGGTESTIPPIALNLIATSPFYGGAPRAGGANSSATDANMLQSARDTCGEVLRSGWAVFAPQFEKGMALGLDHGQVKSFLPGTGHFDLWNDICSTNNEGVVRVFREVGSTGAVRLFHHSDVFKTSDANGNLLYPVNQPVGTWSGAVENGIKTTNKLPWCIGPQDDGAKRRAIEHFQKLGIEKESMMPFCPSALLTKAFGKSVHAVHTVLRDQQLNDQLFEKWTLNGAMNAGVAAFYFMEGVAKGELKPRPTFDQCSTTSGPTRASTKP